MQHDSHKNFYENAKTEMAGVQLLYYFVSEALLPTYKWFYNFICFSLGNFLVFKLNIEGAIY